MERLVQYDINTDLALVITPLKGGTYLVEAKKLVTSMINGFPIPHYLVTFSKSMPKGEINSFLEVAAQVGYPDWMPLSFK